ncbi:MAG: SapC family protein [Desulfovibrio sp.]|nr:SapC family protein [Desulfovibrio sp.]
MDKQNITVLSGKKHLFLTYSPLDDFSFFAKQSAVPLLPFELPQAALCFPIIFPDKRNAMPHALLGLGGVNVFVDDQGQWKAPYLPLLISNYPFSIVKASFSEKSENGEDQSPGYAIGIEENAPHFHQENGQRLFDDNGGPTETLARIENALATQYRRQSTMNKIMAELIEQDCLRERMVTVHYNGMDKNVGGLRCADSEKVFSLPDETLGHWVKNGLMELLYAHWQSMRHLRLLLEDPSCPQSAKGAPVQ